VVGVAIVILAFAGVMLARKINRTLDGVRTAVGQNLGPVSDRARAISDNVEFISHALRTDVERLNASVHALSDRLHQASGRMEERIEDFNALMEVVQEEAEGMFIDTAATMRGLREGAATITRAAATPAVESDQRDEATHEADEGDDVFLEAEASEEPDHPDGDSDAADKARQLAAEREALPTPER
jgi:methyl-accepting chemotaxis protein